VDVEVSQLVGILASGNNMQPISELLLLQVSLCEVFEISLLEGDISGDVNLGLVPCDVNNVSKSSSLSINLDSVVEILFL
jgi:hypothetical protein